VSDIKNWSAFIRGRWDWTRGGYERDFPRGCQFTDVDATTEFDGHRLVIEPKHYDGLGDLPGIPTGQRRYLQDEAGLGKVVFVLYGCGPCNDPHAIEYISDPPVPGRRLYDWRGSDKQRRRKQLKKHIDVALGLSPSDGAEKAA
jgi:hypothetical protein